MIFFTRIDFTLNTTQISQLIFLILKKQTNTLQNTDKINDLYKRQLFRAFDRRRSMRKSSKAGVAFTHSITTKPLCTPIIIRY